MRSWIPLTLMLSLMACGKTEQPQPRAADRPAPRPVADAAPAGEELVAGSAMPPYTAKELDGRDFDIAAERGNVVLLNLWATWCGPCRFEIPELQKLHDQYSSKGFKVIGVSVDEGTNADKEVKAFVAEQKMTYPVVLDREGRLASLFQTTVLPTSAIIDRRGTIVWKHVGVVTLHDRGMLDALTKALAGK